MPNNQQPQKWDIWMAYVPFEENDGRESRRPALVFQFQPTDNKWAVFKMTKTAPRPNFPGEYLMKHWREAGLIYPTTIRLSKPSALSQDSFIRKVGVLHPEDRDAVFGLIKKMYRQQSRKESRAERASRHKEAAYKRDPEGARKALERLYGDEPPTRSQSR